MKAVARDKYLKDTDSILIEFYSGQLVTYKI